MSELIDDILQVREQCLTLLDAAEEALSAIGGNDVKLMFKNVWYPPHLNNGRYEVVGIGRESWRRFIFFGSWQSKTVFYFRVDMVSVRDNTYRYSRIRQKSKSQLIDFLQENGAWGRFYQENSEMKKLIRQACVEGICKPKESCIEFNDSQ